MVKGLFGFKKSHVKILGVHLKFCRKSYVL